MQITYMWFRGSMDTGHSPVHKWGYVELWLRGVKIEEIKTLYMIKRYGNGHQEREYKLNGNFVYRT